MVLILDFVIVNVCITYIRVQILAESKKRRKFDAITLILGKIQNPMKFEPLL